MLVGISSPASSVGRASLNLRVVGSSPTMGDHFDSNLSFCWEFGPG